MDRPIYLSMASLGGKNYFEALSQATSAPIAVPVIGHLNTSKIQLCPQSRGVLDIDAATLLRQRYPDIEFRLHANIKTCGRRAIFDAVDFGNPIFSDRWSQIKELSGTLGSPCYTLHAGLRKSGSLEEMIDRVRWLQDFLGIPVAVEGHYPTKNRDFLLDSWGEHERLLASDVNFVVDLSHFNIIANKEKRIDAEMLLEMLSSPRCIEVHLSGNDGHRDEHARLNGQEWWLYMLESANPVSTIFFEGTPL